MEIGRIPAIAPGTATNTTGGNTVQAVQTILPQYQTVTRAGRSESVPLNFREVPVSNQNQNQTTDIVTTREQGQAEREAQELRGREVRKEIELDRDTSALIFRAIDVSTGDIVRQFPEESRLRLSAYISEVTEEQS